MSTRPKPIPNELLVESREAMEALRKLLHTLETYVDDVNEEVDRREEGRHDA